MRIVLWMVYLRMFFYVVTNIYSWEDDTLIFLFPWFPETRYILQQYQEFVQSEIDREAAAIAEDRERARKAEDRSTGVDERLKKLRDQVSTLQEGVSQVREQRRKCLEWIAAMSLLYISIGHCLVEWIAVQ